MLKKKLQKMSGMSYAATTLPASNKKTNQAYPRGQKLFKSRGSLTGNSGRISKEIGGRISISEKKKGGGERNKRWQNTHAHTHTQRVWWKVLGPTSNSFSYYIRPNNKEKILVRFCKWYGPNTFLQHLVYRRILFPHPRHF